MAVIPLVPETKMVDVGKLISLGNLLVRKVTWFVLTTTSATLILSRAFKANCMTKIAYIYSRLPRTHYTVSTFSLSFHFDFQRQHAFSLFHIFTYRDSTLSRLHFNFQQSTPRKYKHSATFSFLVLPFRLDFFQLRIQPQKFRQTLKETNNPHGRRQMPSSTLCYISIYRYLTWYTLSTNILYSTGHFQYLVFF